MGERKGPCIYISGLPRCTPRPFWKWYYRKMRVIQREHEKAALDMMLFSCGAVVIPQDGSDPYHVPAEDLTLDKPSKH